MNRTNPNTDQFIAFALAHHCAGRLAEAEGIYQQILSRDSANARVLDLIGALKLQSGRPEAAEAFIRRAVAADPNHANYRCNLGTCLRRLGKADEAEAELRRAVQLAPTLAVAHNNLGIVLAESLQFDQAIESYRRAIELDPGYAEAHGNLANALSDAGDFDQALAEARRAIELKPDFAASYNSLGVILAAAGRFVEAINAYRQVIELQPGFSDAWSNLGNALASTGQHDAARAASRRAVDVDPLALQSHWNYAVILLRSGDLAGGFREYEWRWKQQAHFPHPSPRYYPPRFPTPHWTGGEIAGRTILIHAEQGFGDTLHFCRYAPLVAARGGRVIMEVHPELCRLLKSLRGVEQVIPRGQPLPPFDEHCPVMSLPLAFGTTMENVPAEVPYLRPDESDALRWKAIIAQNQVESALRTDLRSDEQVVRNADPTKSLRTTGVPPVSHQAAKNADTAGTAVPRGETRIRNVGLCWAGSPKHADDRDRSLSLVQFAPLALSGVRFHGLQNEGPAADQARHPPSGVDLIDHSARLTDFAETAALIANLDLVITADTAVAHLAGALGKPVWVLLRYLSDWRWLIGRSDTPWYPTMRLFRQTTRGDWDAVVGAVASDLAIFVKEGENFIERHP